MMSFDAIANELSKGMASNRVAQLNEAGRMDLMDAVPAVRGNLAECIAFGRVAGENAAGERPL